MLEFLIFQIIYPPVVGYLATQKGYKYWTWAAIGFFVPVISIFILFALKTKPIIINPEDKILQVNTSKILFKREII